jgi:actin-like ATPase involved in cell morphogenesis
MRVTSGINVESLKNYMREQYPHISFDYTDEEIISYLNQNYVFKLGNDIPKVCNLLADHLLAEGAEAVE